MLVCGSFNNVCTFALSDDIFFLLPLGPGPPADFGQDAVYNARVDLYWKAPCEPNGKILEYEIKYGKTSTNIRQEVIVSGDKEKEIITGLAMLTSYSFQIRARNNIGYSPPNMFRVETKGPASKLKGRYNALYTITQLCCFHLEQP